MKKKILIIMLIILIILVLTYVGITVLYNIERKDNIECCSCCENETEICIDACCDCNYNIFEKLEYILKK